MKYLFIVLFLSSCGYYESYKEEKRKTAQASRVNDESLRLNERVRVIYDLETKDGQKTVCRGFTKIYSSAYEGYGKNRRQKTKLSRQG